MQAPHQTAIDILRGAVGVGADFRDGQWGAIEALLQPGARLLVVQKTGWGKSVVYFVATRLLRHRGPALIVSPLLALMRNQIELAKKFGLNAVSINSTNRDDWDGLVEQTLKNEVDLLLVSPERLRNADFRSELLPYLEKQISLLVIDEAHCISDWGHDFRPDYRRILNTVERLDPNCAIVGTTATANNRVIDDVRSQLGENLQVIRGPLMRDSLKLSVFQIRDQAERLAWLSKYLAKLPGTGIIYTLTVNDANRVAAWLTGQDFFAKAYHADLENEQREQLEKDFRENKMRALVATTALGMGYDKPDVSFVIHFQRPGSVISYYQQVGRAGRSLETAYGVLLEGGEDEDIATWFIDSAFPDAEVFSAVKAALSNGPKSIPQLAAHMNARNRKVDQAIQLMDVEGVVKPAKGRWELVDHNWSYDADRSRQITKQRYQELEQMKDYGTHAGCRMQFLAQALDDAHSELCGRCDRCKPIAETSVSRESIIEARRFLQSDHHPILPRKMLPSGYAEKSKIPESQLSLRGVALCVYNDAGWGALVREGKYTANRFSDDLIAPSAEVIESLEDQPDWMTCVPSTDSRHTAVTASFCRRLAAELGIEFIEVVAKTKNVRPQKEMQNSLNQLSNVYNAFSVVESVPHGICLLVDSGWTLTAIGMKLRDAGAKGVIPFALATTRPRDANG